MTESSDKWSLDTCLLTYILALTVQSYLILSCYYEAQWLIIDELSCMCGLTRRRCYHGGSPVSGKHI